MNPFHRSSSTRSIWVGNDVEVVVSERVGGGKKRRAQDEAQGDEGIRIVIVNLRK